MTRTPQEVFAHHDQAFNAADLQRKGGCPPASAAAGAETGVW
jgi:hypothetical protein